MEHQTVNIVLADMILGPMSLKFVSISSSPSLYRFPPVVLFVSLYLALALPLPLSKKLSSSSCTTCLSVCLSACLSVCLSASLSLSLSLFIPLFLPPSFFMSLSILISLLLRLSLSLSTYLSQFPSPWNPPSFSFLSSKLCLIFCAFGDTLGIKILNLPLHIHPHVSKYSHHMFTPFAAILVRNMGR